MERVFGFILIIGVLGAVIDNCNGGGTKMPSAKRTAPKKVMVDDERPLADNPCHCTHKFNGAMLQLTPPSSKVKTIYNRMLDVVGLSGKGYRICQAKFVNNQYAAFATCKNGLNYIVVNQNLFKDYDNQAMTKVLAHEFGHHFENHVWGPTDPHWHHQLEKETEADYWSGRICYMMGMSYNRYYDLIYRWRGTEINGNYPDYRPGLQGYNDTRAQFEKFGKEKISAKDKSIAKMNLTVERFIKYLGEGKHWKAYALQRNPNWGSLEQFKSSTAFGGITQTSIIAKAHILDPCVGGSNAMCQSNRIKVVYRAVDPTNDKCSANRGKIYEQIFWVEKTIHSPTGYWITQTKLVDMRCANGTT